MNEYEITPYVGVGPLRFGISRADATLILGVPAMFQEDKDSGLTTCYWFDNGLQLLFDSQTGRLVLISFYSNIENIRMDSLVFDWKKTPQIYKELVVADASAKHTVGITVFFKYGLSVSGFLGNTDGDKSLTVFENGQWSPNDPTLKPVAQQSRT